MTHVKTVQEICDERVARAWAENERLSQRLTDVRTALTEIRDELEHEDTDNEKMWEIARKALARDVADWQAIQKQVQETAKKAREARR